VLEPAASGRVAVGEALTNILAAGPLDLDQVRLSANWMAASGVKGEDEALFDTVSAVTELCRALRIAIPVGKDSLSMRTAWQEHGAPKAVVAPVSLIVSAFAPVADVRRVLTPQLRADPNSFLYLLDLGAGRNRLGGSCLAQVYGVTGGRTPDLEDPQRLRQLFACLADLHQRGLVLAYHDRSDGGLFVTLCEMAFAGHSGIVVDLDAVIGSPAQPWRLAPGIEAPVAPASASAELIATLFAEELGAAIQVRGPDLSLVLGVMARHGLDARVVARPHAAGTIRVERSGTCVFEDTRVALHRAWSETTWQMQSVRDNPACAQQEYDRILDAGDPGLSPHLTFDPADDVAAPFIGRGARPPIAVLREQGVNGQVELAAAFDRAGFAAADVHMSDVIAGRVSLAGFKGFVAPGGFSYGDVLGGGEGWAKSILFNPRARDEFAAFFARKDSFALGVCNGCQMMGALHELIPGAEAWPRFVKNRSEQFEGRLVLVEIPESPSLFFAGMAGSRIPVVTAHGEGRALFTRSHAPEDAIVCMRYVDNRGRATESYPYNVNGSPLGITGVTTADGRFTAFMPHPERVFRSVQMSWHPKKWGEDSPWMRLFRNARAWVGDASGDR
jgi:phosphoribosylformylglycinamidine synthase